MYLTDKRNGVPRQLDDHEDLEVLLESFSKQVEEIVNEAENIQVSYNCPWFDSAHAQREYSQMSNLRKRL